MAMTFNELKELIEASSVQVSNFNVSGEVAVKILNDFQKANNKDLMEALAMATAIKTAQQVEADAAKAEAEAAAQKAEEQRNAWREILTGLNEKQKTVALYLKGVLQYTINEGIIIIGQSIIDAIVNNEGSFQIAVRITMALDKAQNLNVSNRQQYDKEIEDFLSDIGSIIRRNNNDSVIDKINKTFDTYIEMSAATPSEE